MFLMRKEAIVDRAMQILDSQLMDHKVHGFTRPEALGRYLKLRFAKEEREVFSVVTMDNMHAITGVHELFVGTVNQAAVFPREVVKLALRENAAAVTICHNHPAGFTAPSEADKFMTVKIKHALDTVDISLLDHFIVGAYEPFSFRKEGLL